MTLAYKQFGHRAAQCFWILEKRASKITLLDATENSSQVVFCALVHNFRTTKGRSEFSRIRDRQPHSVDTALEQKVGNQFDFLQARDICKLRLVAGFDQRIKAGFDQFGQSAAQDG